MKTMTVIAATLIATAGLGTVAQAQQTQPMLTGQEKAMRYQEDQRQKVWNEQRLQQGEARESATFGAPNRQSFGRAEAEDATAAPSSFSIPGSGAAMYSYDANNKGWAYGY